MISLSFVAYGVPQPKGSAKAFIPKGWNRAIVTSDNPKNKGWQQIVAEAASAELSPAFVLLDGPIGLTVRFYLPRPKLIKAKTVPHLKKPDLDKLVRSVKDALSQVVWQDDSQVVLITAVKTYAYVGQVPRAEIHVREVEVT